MTLVEIVQADTALTWRRGEYWGCCVFHPERTPSFSVNAEKGVYYCFGCGASGDAITYLRRTRGYSFREAAAHLGMDLPAYDRQGQARRAAAWEPLLRAYYEWWHRKLRAYNALLDELAIAELAFRALCRAPERWAEHDHAYWCKRLGDLYFAHSVALEDLQRTDAELFAAWEEERHGSSTP